MLKQKIWNALNVDEKNIFKSINLFLIILIFLNILSMILESVKSIENKYEFYFICFEYISIIIFSIEYFLRIWSCSCCENYKSPLIGRLKFIITPLMIIDLISILPFYLTLTTIDLRFTRIVRLFRIIKIAKIGRYSSSLKLFTNVLKNKKEELIITLFFIMSLIIISSSIMYFVENKSQPDKFPDIPSTTWWAVMTLTTVGYGDIYPITIIGKIFTGIISILGIGIFALPTSILGSGFIEEIQKKKNIKNICPNCNHEIPS